jgi:Peptidase family M23
MHNPYTWRLVPAIVLLAGGTWLLSGSFRTPATNNQATMEAEPVYPSNYFSSPVDDALRLTGTFGELRSGHFHSGIDIKSKTGGVGQPVFAAADGFVDQIKVQSGGYGNVVYLKHPNGYTTVYAHLDAFSSELSRFVREHQYKNESFEVALSPADGQFKVKKGQQIGTLGNSGGSTGPHLHFEIRQSSTGKALNPLLFNLPVPDRSAPDIRDMKFYVLDEKRQPITSSALPIVRRVDGTYRPKQGDTLRVGAWRVGFSVKAYDQQDLLRNDNGIFSIDLEADGQLAYACKLDGFDFDETRYLNAHVDYAVHERFGAWFHRCFVLPGDKLSIYRPTAALGAVALYKERPVQIRLRVADAAGNAGVVQFWVIRDDNMATAVNEPYQYEFVYNTENRIESQDFSLRMPAGCLYEDLKFQYKTTPETSSGFFSSVHHIHHEEAPVHRYFEVAMSPFNLPDQLRSKAVIARCGNNRPVNCGGVWKDGKLTTRIRNFGDYCIMTDVMPPTIVPLVFDNDMRKRSSMSFRIDDNFNTDAQADRLYYRGTIDGKWVLFEYDMKRERLTYIFDWRTPPGEHTLRLLVRDDRRNEAVFERKFLR